MFLVSLILSNLGGCSNKGEKPEASAPEFRKLYDQLRELPQPRVEKRSPGRTMSISAEKMPLSSFLRYVSDKTGVSIIAEEKLDEKEVTLDMREQDVGLVLSVVARRLGVQVTRSGNLYYLGKLRNEDRGVLVRKVRRLSQEELKSAVAVLLSDNGRAETYADGLVVIGDRVEVLERLAELLDGIESAPSNSWIVQLHLVSLSETFFKDAGLDVNPAAEIAASFAMVDVDDSAGQLTANASLRAVLAADRQDDSVSIVTEPSFVLLDGTIASFRDARQTPVRVRTVSPEGTVTDTGFQTVQTGTEVVCEIRELGSDRAKLRVDVTSSSVAGSVEDIPIVDEQAFTTEASVQAGGVYLLGSFNRARDAQQVRSITATAKRTEREARTVYVWARTYRIAGPIGESDEGIYKGKSELQQPDLGKRDGGNISRHYGPRTGRFTSTRGPVHGGPAGQETFQGRGSGGGTGGNSFLGFGSGNDSSQEHNRNDYIDPSGPPSPSASQPQVFTPDGLRTVDDGEGGPTPSPEAERLKGAPVQTTSEHRTPSTPAGQQRPAQSPLYWWGGMEDFRVRPDFPILTSQMWKAVSL